MMGGAANPPGEKWRRRLPVMALLAVTVVGGVLRFYRIGRNGFWLDEAFSVWMAEHPLPALFSWLTAIDQHPPLYYTLLHGWLLPGDEAAYVRMLSACLSTLTIPVLFLLVHRLAGVRAGLVAALILALSPFQVRFAQEARMYALLMLTVSLATLALVLILTDTGKPSSRWWHRRWLAWALYIVFTAASVLTHNTALFFPLATNLFVIGFILYRRLRPAASVPAAAALPFTPPPFTLPPFTPPPLRRWLLAQAGVLLIWLPWSVAFVVQSIGVYQQFWIPAPTLESVAGTFKTLLNDFLSPRLAPPELVWLGYALLLVLGAVSLRKRLPVLAFLLVLLLTPLCGELLVSLRRPIFYDRTLIWITIPLSLLLAFGIVQLRWRALVTLGLVLLCTVNLLSLQNYYETFKKEQWREAAAYVARKVHEDDLILFNATWVQIPFDYYFRRFDRSVAQHGAPVDLFDGGVLEPKMAASDLPRLRSLLRDHDRVWLVYSHDWYTDPQRIIPAALAEELKLVGTQHYYGLQVLRYERR